MTLSARIAALEGPDRAVDAEVAVAALGFITKPNEWWPDLTDYGYVEPDGGVVWPGHGGDQFVPRFTASLDAAMSVFLEKPDMVPSCPIRCLSAALMARGL